ncbi:MAG TPA: tetratricopeptide repeat protein, partial [Phycisphaerae bacterium]|nr:tetratricopeptide repeat protein [Phycisphaerae bacterium]
MMQITIQQAINTALECYNAGRLNQAEAICRQIIVQDPNHADALHMLGLIAGRAGNHKTAVELIGRAIQINPSAAEYQVHLGLSLF